MAKTVKKQRIHKRKPYSTISVDKRLTPKERVLCLEYIKTKNATQAAIAAGYSPRTARATAWRIINEKPNTKAFIENALSRMFDRLDFDSFDVLQRIGHIAMCDPGKLTPIREGRVIVPETDDLSKEVKALFAGAQERVNERGDITVEVKQHDQMAALKLLCQYYGILDKARGAKQAPLIEQKQAIQSVLDGSKTPIDAALELELQGIPLPETLRILISKIADTDDDSDNLDSVIPTPEEMDARRQERLSEIEGQKENFLPKRQEEIRDLKKSLGKKNREFADDDGVVEDG